MATDNAFTESNFERTENDSYYTEHAITKVLIPRMPDGIVNVWEPFAGRGDMVRILQDFGGFNVFATDIDTTKYDTGLGTIEQLDFLSGQLPTFMSEENIHAICSNPPFGKQAALCVRHALTTFQDIRFFAFVLRSNWKHAVTYRDLFGTAYDDRPAQPYAKEIVLQWRPRWDWWFRDKPEASPIHQYSIFCWDRAHTGPAIQQFAMRGH